MQKITAAHARNDLHALLQLELERLGGPSGDAARLSVEKLPAYTELLKQQAAELADEVRSLQLHPRYAALIVEGPFGLPVEEVRGAIREYRESEKRQRLAGRRRR